MDILHEFGYLGGVPIQLAMKHELDFRDDKSPPMKDPSLYRRLIDKLIYLTITRLDIYFVVQNLIQFLDNPSTYQWEADLKILKISQKIPRLRDHIL